MPQETQDKLRQLVRQALVNTTVEKFKAGYTEDNGKAPTQKTLKTLRRITEQSEEIDRQVDDVIRAAVPSGQAANFLTIVGSVLLLGVAASLTAAIFWEAYRPWTPSVTLVLAAAGLGLTFNSIVVPFVKSQRIASAVFAVVVLALAVALRYSVGRSLEVRSSSPDRNKTSFQASA